MNAGSVVALTALVEPDVQVGCSIRIGPGAVVLQESQEKLPQTKICDFVEIGANATIRPGVTIGRSARVMPGVVVTRTMPPFAIIDGFPGRVVSYRSTSPEGDRDIDEDSCSAVVQATSVGRVSRHRLNLINDSRGSLVPGEFDAHLPFLPKRFFLVLDVPSLEVRGEHAHHACEQFLIAVRGSVRVVADDGKSREEFILDRPDIGLYLPPMTWGTQYQYSLDCVLLVFASHHYDAADYIRNYDNFLNYCRSGAGSGQPLDQPLESGLNDYCRVN